jgi:predicted RecB family nuclease
MRFVSDSLLLAPTDLATFVGCRHKTGLDLAVARHMLTRPRYEDPFAAILQRRGEEHEQRYVESLRARGLKLVVIAREDGPATAASLARQTADTLAAMRDGADVVVQARLADDHMAGYADVLMRVEQPSGLGGWSYEAHDTKLARETKGGAILQLCAYSDMLTHMQGRAPEHFHVVTPDPVQPLHSYRVNDYLAYYRMVRAALVDALALGHHALLGAHYPEPVEHCGVCAWEARCMARRRKDDHLSFIAGAGRMHRQELAAQGHPTLTSAATMAVPVTFKPSRGARETYDRLGDQARVQHQQRIEKHPVFERLPVVAGEGLTRLPEPSRGDIFLDLEGARFAREGGREFLFGIYEHSGYRSWWAMNDAEEKAAFEEVMDVLIAAWQADPGMHVYHFNHYEPTAFKRLVGRHVTRGEALDQLLRAERFVDLYPIARQAARCGVESYSIKQLEQYSGYQRRVALANASQPLMAVELALEAGVPGDITAEIRDAVQGYNEDDCRSTEALRDWLEMLRAQALGGGDDIPRPTPASGDPSAAVSELQQEVEKLRQRLLDGLPPEAPEPVHAEHWRWLLAYLIDWHKREENADWWEYFRLKEMPAEDLFDERDAIAGLTFVERVGFVPGKSGKPTRSVVDRYTYPPQEVEIGGKGRLNARDGKAFGEVVAHDRLVRVIDIRKGPSRADLHPSEVFACDVISTKGPQQSVMRLAGEVVARSEVLALRTNEGPSIQRCGLALLRREPPRLTSGTFERRPGESAGDFAVRIVQDLRRSTLAIQGPPGAGKTHVGAQMIRALVRAGRRVGVTATSHKVIRNLLHEVAAQAATAGERVRVAAKVGEAEENGDGDRVREFEGNEEALAAIGTEVEVLGGTAWLWSREDAAGAVDVLFVDEAGQMSLANVLAVSQAADSVVLLGDPRQLDQPQKASHPDGVGISALEHVLNGAETMPQGLGIFLPTTWRMSPAITRFTSELFYEGKLEAKAGLEAQVLRGTARHDGSGLWLIPVEHDGNQNASVEEVSAVAELVQELLASGAGWVDERGDVHGLTGPDIEVVAPFNAQVNRLAERLGPLGVPVGTVDKFQGQTAAVVIYSMTTSRPEDAPRGMEFLYSLNRLNVATSRARCAVFVVCSPRLLEPECRTPRQMHLANALCRYRELCR